MANYYFFVSGLPDLIIDDRKNVPAFLDFISEAQDQLSVQDMDLLNTIRLQIDNMNLITLLEKRNTDFDPRGVYSHDELVAALKDGEMLPEYLRLFVEAHLENKQLHGGLIAEDQLNLLFFREMMNSSNEFISKWFTFESDLRNLLVGINSRKGLEHFDALGTERSRSTESTVVGHNEIAEAMIRSTAPDFGVTQQLPWAERVIQLSKGPLLDFEKGIDNLRWELAGDLTAFAYFSVEAVIAFTIKLLIVERWMKLDPAIGRAKLERLVQELRASTESSVHE